ncbi:MAG: prepilin-type N-terminal cleavage/methylation domain-containing protein [Candidatus Omnitrophica bacterium]|nr:prepilin-type N-terminal cleavage/methylation domain-containing protein [Candidatus Omnitrophota bacterium]
MDRLKKSGQGFTLLELVIGIALSAVVLLAASNLLINFGKFSSNVVKSEASLMGTALGSFEEITGEIVAANKVVIPPELPMDVPATPYPVGCAGSNCIQIRVDPIVRDVDGNPVSTTPSVFSDDIVYTYWEAGNQLFKAVGAGAGSVIADDIVSLSFTRPVPSSMNIIKVSLEAQVSSGSISDPAKNKTKEHLETTVAMRSGGAA